MIATEPLEFEKPIVNLERQLGELREKASDSDIDMSSAISATLRRGQAVLPISMGGRSSSLVIRKAATPKRTFAGISGVLTLRATARLCD